jgi:hypothetical protein
MKYKGCPDCTKPSPEPEPKGLKPYIENPGSWGSAMANMVYKRLPDGSIYQHPEVPVRMRMVCRISSKLALYQCPECGRIEASS